VPIKLAAFNIQNLFSRPKAMNLANENAGTQKLFAIAGLQDELDNEVYDKPRIAALAKSAHGYFEINKTRGPNPLTYSRETGEYKVNVNGRRQWEGFIELTRDGFSFESINNTGAFLRQLGADILGLCEVEDRWALRRFRGEQLEREGLFYDLLIDGNDPRRIDVAVLSRFAPGKLRTNVFYRLPKTRQPLFSRDCFEAELLLPNGESLYILQNHFKSRLGRPQDSERKRMAQATRVREIVQERYDLSSHYVAVMGDFNDTPDSPALQPLLTMPGLRSVQDIAGIPEGERWTYYYNKEKARNEIDYILISDALARKMISAGADKGGIAGISALTDGAVTGLPGITTWRNAASDHAAVWVELDL
jgi:endonuclease/exonuclease/phosphatase family metal-dependent hydrolase